MPAEIFTRPVNIAQDLTPTITPSLTPSGTPTPTTIISVTPTGTPQFSSTPTTAATGTLTAAPSPSPTPTFGLAVTLTPTFTLQPTPFESPTSTPFEPTITPTYIPLPAVTFVWPDSQPKTEILSFQREPGEIEKQRRSALANLLWRLWPLGLVFFIWGILAIWIVFIQKRLE